MQKIFIAGRLGRDLTLKETTSGERFYATTVAVNSRVRGAEKTTWYDVMSFNTERYKNMAAYLTKGTGVNIVGDLDASVQTGNDNVTRLRLSIMADSIEFGGGSSSTSGTTETTATKVTTETVDEPTKPAPKKTRKTVVVEEVPDDIPMNGGDAEASAEDDLPF